jgi:LysR family transcriptional regulator, hydrogen peroxide-inducible genes activator
VEIHQLEYLSAVAEEGSISQAARRLGVAQPSLSQQLKKLEDELGHRLLDRLPKGVVPTEAGRQLIEHARRVLAEIADARRRIGDTPGHVAGSLAVGAIPTMAPFLLPGVLRRFAARWPDVKLTVVEDVTQRLLAMLERGEVDVAVMSDANVPATVHAETIATESLRLMLPATHRLVAGKAKADKSGSAAAAATKRKGASADGPAGAAHATGKAVPWSAVAGERLLVLQEMHCLAGQVSRFCDRARVRPPVFMRGAQLTTIAAMVSAGLGVSVVPEMMCRAGPWAGCVTRPLAGEHPTRDVCVAWSLLRYRTNAARAFDEMLRQSL